MGFEEQIEDQIIANLGWFKYQGSAWIRRAKLGREGFGTVDLLLLPESGLHRLVLIEVKHAGSADTPGRLVGQLLAYYLAALRLGSTGLDCLRQFARQERAHRTGGKSLQMLSGLGPGSKHKDLELLRAGTPVAPADVALLIVIGSDEAASEVREGLADVRDWLWKNGRLDVPVALARSDGSFEWLARPGVEKGDKEPASLVRFLPAFSNLF